MRGARPRCVALVRRRISHTRSVLAPVADLMSVFVHGRPSRRRASITAAISSSVILGMRDIPAPSVSGERATPRMGRTPAPRRRGDGVYGGRVRMPAGRTRPVLTPSQRPESDSGISCIPECECLEDRSAGDADVGYPSRGSAGRFARNTRCTARLPASTRSRRSPMDAGNPTECADYADTGGKAGGDGGGVARAAEHAPPPNRAPRAPGNSFMVT